MIDRAARTARTSATTRAGGAALALAMLLAGCASGTETGAAPAAPATANPSSTPSVLASPSNSESSGSASPQPSTAAPSRAAADVTVEIRIADGKITTGIRNVKVDSGQSVLIRGVSDVADSLHVHGYDQSLDLEPGKPAELIFTADVAGVFEIETHETAKLVAKLTVT